MKNSKTSDKIKMGIMFILLVPAIPALLAWLMLWPDDELQHEDARETDNER